MLDKTWKMKDYVKVNEKIKLTDREKSYRELQKMIFLNDAIHATTRHDAISFIRGIGK